MQVYAYGGIGPGGLPIDPYALAALDSYTLTARSIALQPSMGPDLSSSGVPHAAVGGGSSAAALRGRSGHGMVEWRGQLVVYGGLLQQPGSTHKVGGLPGGNSRLPPSLPCHTPPC